MKISLQSAITDNFNQNAVRGSVVGEVEGKTMLLINGVPTLAGAPLPPDAGQTFLGHLDSSESKLAGMTLIKEGNPIGTTISAEQWLASVGLPVDEHHKFLCELFRQFGLSYSLEFFKKALRWYFVLQPKMHGSEAEAFGLLLFRRLPKEAFQIIKKYTEGKMQMGSLLSKLSNESLKKWRNNWHQGKLLEKISSLFQASPQSQIAGFEKSEAGDLADNLMFQEILSQPPVNNHEGSFYFQWPIFWADSQIPDTLEGEAFYPPKDKSEGGFSLRLLVQPPRLGLLEIGIHQIQKSLWVHFGLDNSTFKNAIAKLEPILKDRFQSLGWREIRITIGEKSQRKHFLSPVESAHPPSVSSGVDVRI